MISEAYNIDCLEAMRTMKDNEFELAIVDPPYGININSNMGLKKGQAKRHEEKGWDKHIPPDEYFVQLRRVSVNQIVWGGNYFPLGISRHVIWWEKETPEGMSFSDGELAWTSFDRANKSYKRNNVTNDKIHPTQKPIELYKWLLKNYAKLGDIILDTHLGSGSSRIAAYQMGFDFIGYEIDKDYFEAQEKRYKTAIQQQSLFNPNEMY